MNQQQTAHLIGVMIGAFLAGVICGLLPLFLGLSYKRLELGVIGLVACIIGGFIRGIFLAIPISVIFTVIILSLGSQAKRRRPIRRRRRWEDDDDDEDLDDDDDDDDEDYRPRPRRLQR